MTGRARGSYIGILPGRSVLIDLCHHDPASCARCLQRIARFLAGEMGRDFEAAMRRSTESYQAELGADRCTLDQARTLRRLTCLECIPSDALFVAQKADMMLADEDAAGAEPTLPAESSTGGLRAVLRRVFGQAVAG